MPSLVDTTIRLLSQEPLAGRVPGSALFDVAEILDGAGFACLEVSGGGVFDSCVRRGVESPWERIRALNERTKTPLGMALRGRFLVGSRPVGGRSEEHTSELQSRPHLVCRLLLEKKKKNKQKIKDKKNKKTKNKKK